jgi:hypothetical protein
MNHVINWPILKINLRINVTIDCQPVINKTDRYDFFIVANERNVTKDLEYLNTSYYRYILVYNSNENLNYILKQT